MAKRKLPLVLVHRIGCLMTKQIMDHEQALLGSHCLKLHHINHEIARLYDASQSYRQDRTTKLNIYATYIMCTTSLHDQLKSIGTYLDESMTSINNAYTISDGRRDIVYHIIYPIRDMIAKCTEIINESSTCWHAYSINNIDTIHDSLQACIYKLDGQIFAISDHLVHIYSSGMFKHMISNPPTPDNDNRTIQYIRCLASSQSSMHHSSYDLHESSGVDARRYQIHDKVSHYRRDDVYACDGRYDRDDVNDVLADCVADTQSIDRDERVKKMADLCMRDGYDGGYESDHGYNACYESDHEYDDDWLYDNDADME